MHVDDPVAPLKTASTPLWKRIRLLIIEATPLMQSALLALLKDHPLIAELSASRSLKHAAQSNDAIDIVLLDLHLPGYTDLEALIAARAQWPHAAIIALCMSSDKATVLAALDAGATGYVPKTYELHAISSAMEIVLRGGAYVPALHSASLVSPHQFKRRASDKHTSSQRTQRRRASDEPMLIYEQLGLSARQTEVLSLLMRGMANKLICRKLAISENTVKTHIAAIFRTLGVRNRTEAVIALSQHCVAMMQADERAALA